MSNMRYHVCKSYKNSRHFQVWANFNVEVFQTIRCRQRGKSKTGRDGLYSFECTRLDVKNLRDNQVFEEVTDFKQLL